MAKTTEAERQKMRQSGIYHAEKCDKCGNPLAEFVYEKMGPKKDEKWCPICGRGKNMVAANLQEETRMKKVAKDKKDSGGTKKLFGFIVQGTAIYDLAIFLMDEKKHKISDAMKSMSKHKADKMGRIHQLVRYGKKKKFGTITIDEDTIQLKLAKGVTADSQVEDAEPEEKVETATKKIGKEEKTEKKPKKNDREPEEEEETEEEPEEKPTKKVKKKKEEPEEESEEETEEEKTPDESEDEEEVDEKALKSTAKLVRMTLKNKKKEWNKNKLIETIVKDHGVDQKRIEAALLSEIKNGGVTDENGVLELA